MATMTELMGSAMAASNPYANYFKAQTGTAMWAVPGAAFNMARGAATGAINATAGTARSVKNLFGRLKRDSPAEAQDGQQESREQIQQGQQGANSKGSEVNSKQLQEIIKVLESGFGDTKSNLNKINQLLSVNNSENKELKNALNDLIQKQEAQKKILEVIAKNTQKKSAELSSPLTKNITTMTTLLERIAKATEDSAKIAKLKAGIGMNSEVKASAIMASTGYIDPSDPASGKKKIWADEIKKIQKETAEINKEVKEATLHMSKSLDELNEKLTPEKRSGLGGAFSLAKGALFGLGMLGVKGGIAAGKALGKHVVAPTYDYYKTGFKLKANAAKEKIQSDALARYVKNVKAAKTAKEEAKKLKDLRKAAVAEGKTATYIKELDEKINLAEMEAARATKQSKIVKERHKITDMMANFATENDGNISGLDEFLKRHSEKNKAVPFDAQTRDAIISGIPLLLSEILKALNGQDKQWNYYLNRLSSTEESIAAEKAAAQYEHIQASQDFKNSKGIFLHRKGYGDIAQKVLDTRKAAQNADALAMNKFKGIDTLNITGSMKSIGEQHKTEAIHTDQAMYEAHRANRTHLGDASVATIKTIGKIGFNFIIVPAIKALTHVIADMLDNVDKDGKFFKTYIKPNLPKLYDHCNSFRDIHTTAVEVFPYMMGCLKNYIEKIKKGEVGLFEPMAMGLKALFHAKDANGKTIIDAMKDIITELEKANSVESDILLPILDFFVNKAIPALRGENPTFNKVMGSVNNAFKSAQASLNEKEEVDKNNILSGMAGGDTNKLKRLYLAAGLDEAEAERLSKESKDLKTDVSDVKAPSLMDVMNKNSESSNKALIDVSGLGNKLVESLSKVTLKAELDNSHLIEMRGALTNINKTTEEIASNMNKSGKSEEYLREISKILFPSHMSNTALVKDEILAALNRVDIKLINIDNSLKTISENSKESTKFDSEQLENAFINGVARVFGETNKFWHTFTFYTAKAILIALKRVEKTKTKPKVITRSIDIPVPKNVITKWEKVKRFLSDIAGGLGKFYSGLRRLVIDFGGVSKAIWQSAKKACHGLYMVGKGALDLVGLLIDKVVSPLANMIGPALTYVGDKLWDLGKGLLKGFGKLIEGVWWTVKKIKDIGVKAVDMIGSVFSAILHPLTFIKQKFMSILKFFVGGIAGVFKTGWNFLKGVGSAIGGLFGGKKIERQMLAVQEEILKYVKMIYDNTNTLIKLKEESMTQVVDSGFTPLDHTNNLPSGAASFFGISLKRKEEKAKEKREKQQTDALKNIVKNTKSIDTNFTKYSKWQKTKDFFKMFGGVLTTALSSILSIGGTIASVLMSLTGLPALIKGFGKMLGFDTGSDIGADKKGKNSKRSKGRIPSGALKGAGNLLKFGAKFLGPVGLAITAGTAALDGTIGGIDGYKNADKIFGVEQATTQEKVTAAAGGAAAGIISGLLNTVTLGYADSMAKSLGFDNVKDALTKPLAKAYKVSYNVLKTGVSGVWGFLSGSGARNSVVNGLATAGLIETNFSKITRINDPQKFSKLTARQLKYCLDYGFANPNDENLAVKLLAAAEARGESSKGYFTEMWDNTKQWVSDAWKKYKEYINSLIEATKDKLKEVWNSIKKYAKNMVNKVKLTIKSIWDSITNTVKGVINTALRYLKDAWTSLKDTVSNLFAPLTNFLGDTFGKVKAAVSDIWDSVTRTVTGAIDGTLDFIKGAWNSLKESVVAVWESLKEGVANIVDGVVNAFTFGKKEEKPKAQVNNNNARTTYQQVNVIMDRAQLVGSIRISDAPSVFTKMLKTLESIEMNTRVGKMASLQDFANNGGMPPSEEPMSSSPASISTIPNGNTPNINRSKAELGNASKLTPSQQGSLAQNAKNASKSQSEYQISSVTNNTAKS